MLLFLNIKQGCTVFVTRTNERISSTVCKCIDCLMLRYLQFTNLQVFLFLFPLCRSHTSSGLCPEQKRCRVSGLDPLHHEAFPTQWSHSLPLQPHPQNLCHYFHLRVQWKPVSRLSLGLVWSPKVCDWLKSDCCVTKSLTFLPHTHTHTYTL